MHSRGPGADGHGFEGQQATGSRRAKDRRRPLAASSACTPLAIGEQARESDGRLLRQRHQLDAHQRQCRLAALLHVAAEVLDQLLAALAGIDPTAEQDDRSATAGERRRAHAPRARRWDGTRPGASSVGRRRRIVARLRPSATPSSSATVPTARAGYGWLAVKCRCPTPQTSSMSTGRSGEFNAPGRVAALAVSQVTGVRRAGLKTSLKISIVDRRNFIVGRRGRPRFLRGVHLPGQTQLPSAHGR